MVPSAASAPPSARESSEPRTERRVRSPGRSPGGRPRVARAARGAPLLGVSAAPGERSSGSRGGWGLAGRACPPGTGAGIPGAASACCRPGRGLCTAASALEPEVPLLWVCLFPRRRARGRARSPAACTRRPAHGVPAGAGRAAQSESVSARWKAMVIPSSDSVAGPFSCLGLGREAPCASPPDAVCCYVALDTLKP